jgi:hypothetical protein
MSVLKKYKLKSRSGDGSYVSKSLNVNDKVIKDKVNWFLRKAFILTSSILLIKG